MCFKHAKISILLFILSTATQEIISVPVPNPDQTGSPQQIAPGKESPPERPQGPKLKPPEPEPTFEPFPQTRPSAPAKERQPEPQLDSTIQEPSLPRPMAQAASPAKQAQFVDNTTDTKKAQASNFYSTNSVMANGKVLARNVRRETLDLKPENAREDSRNSDLPAASGSDPMAANADMKPEDLPTPLPDFDSKPQVARAPHEGADEDGDSDSHKADKESNNEPMLSKQDSQMEEAESHSEPVLPSPHESPNDEAESHSEPMLPSPHESPNDKADSSSKPTTLPSPRVPQKHYTKSNTKTTLIINPSPHVPKTNDAESKGQITLPSPQVAHKDDTKPKILTINPSKHVTQNDDGASSSKATLPSSRAMQTNDAETETKSKTMSPPSPHVEQTNDAESNGKTMLPSPRAMETNDAETNSKPMLPSPHATPSTDVSKPLDKTKFQHSKAMPACPSLSDFIRGSETFWTDVKKVSDWSEGVGVASKKLMLSLSALSFCLDQLNSEISQMIHKTRPNNAPITKGQYITDKSDSVGLVKG